MKNFGLFVILLILASSVIAQDRGFSGLSDYGVKVAPDKRVVAVLTALEVGGIKTPLGEAGEKTRSQIQTDFAELDPSLREKLKAFVEQYERRKATRSASERLSSFVALAYSLSDAPSLKTPENSADLPDDVLDVLDFAPLVKEFYSAPGVASKIDSYFNQGLKESNLMMPSAREMVLSVLDYLHTRPELGYTETTVTDAKGKKNKGKKFIQSTTFERGFSIVPSPLIPKGTVAFLNIKENYVAVVSPDTDLTESEARRGYLQYVLDPLMLTNAATILQKGSGIKMLLEERRKTDRSISPDVILAVSRSLVAATDAKEEEYRRLNIATAQARSKIALLKTDEEKRSTVKELDRLKGIFADETALQLSESYERGAVLSFFFAKKLKEIEDSGFDVANSLKIWLEELEPAAESARLSEFSEASSRAKAERLNRKKEIETTLVNNPLTEALLGVDKDISAKNFAKAEADLVSLLTKFPSGSARIYYSLGRNASRSAEGIADSDEVNTRLLKAKAYFEKVLLSGDPDRELNSLTYISLARIYEFYNQEEYAIKLYNEALKAGTPGGEGFRTALEAKKRLQKN